LVGCSSKTSISCPKYPTLVKYDAPKPLKLKIKQSGSKDEKIKSLENALQKLVIKTRKQNEIIKAYEYQIDIINSIKDNK
jgi:hypothetical protein